MCRLFALLAFLCLPFSTLAATGTNTITKALEGDAAWTDSLSTTVTGVVIDIIEGDSYWTLVLDSGSTIQVTQADLDDLGLSDVSEFMGATVELTLTVGGNSTNARKLRIRL